MEFDSILQCNERERSAFVRNESCKPTKLVRLVPSGDLSFISVSPSVGNWIAPGDSVELRVRLRPRATGNRQDKVTLYYRDSSGSDQDLTVDLHAFVIADIPHDTMSTTAIAMDSIAPCSSRDNVVTITNQSLCDTVTITQALVRGSPWFGADTTNLPISIAPGQTDSVRIHVQTHQRVGRGCDHSNLLARESIR